ncbi:MAG: hypothetical protein NTW14_06720 [bacterium]|nr:hypothetical protein [bacterium]
MRLKRRQTYLVGLPAVLLVLILFLAGCSSEDKQPITPPPDLSEVQWASKLPNLVFESSNYYLVQARAIFTVEPDSIVVYIVDATGGNVAAFHLYDDASAYPLSDALQFCDTHSGDLVANNGIYTRLVNAKFADNQGNYLLKLMMWVGNSEYQDDNDTLVVGTSQAPQVSGLICPDTLKSGFAPLQITVQAFDPDPPASDSVVAVVMKQYELSSGLQYGDSLTLQPSGSTNYGVTLTPAFALGRLSGFYTFVFRAWDSFSMLSDSLGRIVYVENFAPHLSNPTFPDSIGLPEPENIIEVLISIKAFDDQTNLDIDKVYMFSRKPNGEMANGGNPIPMADNGLPFDPALWSEGYLGDQTAGDSLFSTTAILYDTSMVGTYTFTFRSSDLAGNLSDTLITSMVVTP